MKNTQTIQILSDSATLYDSAGFIQDSGLTVHDYGDTISIGSTQHAKVDLTITKARIESVHGWELKL